MEIDTGIDLGLTSRQFLRTAAVEAGQFRGLARQFVPGADGLMGMRRGGCLNRAAGRARRFGFDSRSFELSGGFDVFVMIGLLLQGAYRCGNLRPQLEVVDRIRRRGLSFSL